MTTTWLKDSLALVALLTFILGGGVAFDRLTAHGADCEYVR